MTDITVKYPGVTKAMAQWGQNKAAPAAGAAGAGLATEQAPRFSSAEIDSVRSYAVEIETKEVLHLDRVRNPWVIDIVKAIEKMAEMTVAGRKSMWVWVGGGDSLTLKLTDFWRVKIMRDAVVIKVSDCALVADDKFLLLCAEEGGRYVPLAKGEEITWDGTEEFFTPRDIIRLAKEVARRVLEQARWI